MTSALSEPLADRFRTLVHREQTRGRVPSVSAAVFADGEVIWSCAIGLADIEGGVEAASATQYRIGSITKTFTAAAVMQLRDAGAVSLDDPLGAHVPGLAHAELTLGRMLSHTSGIQTEVPGEFWQQLVIPDTQAIIERMDEAERVGRPAARWHYSNLAYALLGEVVARTTGMRFQEYVTGNLLEPLRLTRTTWERAEPSAKGYLVHPYHDAPERDADDVELGDAAALGGLWSTTGDLARWAGFLVRPDPRVLSPASAEEMRTVQAICDPAAWTRGWGRGLAHFREGDRVFVGHAGSMPGHLGCLAVRPESGVGAVALQNATAGGTPEALVLALATEADRALSRRDEPWRPDEAPPAHLAAVLGRWWGLGTEYVLRIRGGRLEVAGEDPRHPEEATVFEPEGADRFRAVAGRHRGELLRIVRDEEGRPVRLYLATYPLDRRPLTYFDHARPPVPEVDARA